MQVALVTLEAFPRVGGVASFLRYSLEAAGALGIRPLLVAPTSTADVVLPCDHSQSLANLYRASRALRQIEAEVVYLAEAAAIRAALWAWKWTLSRRIRLILHGSEILSFGHMRRFRELLEHAEQIYTLSRAVAELALSVVPHVAEKLVVTGAAPSSGLTFIDGLREEKRLLTVGRLHPRKGQHEILEAMAGGLLPEFSYDIAGPSRDRAYAQRLQRLSAGLPVRLLGDVAEGELSLLYARASFFVLPAVTLKNRMEGYGLALLDAAAMGCVAIAYDCGGVGEALQHCRTGLLIPPGDRRAFLDALLQLTRDERAWREFSLAAQKFAAAKSWTVVAQKLFA